MKSQNQYKTDYEFLKPLLDRPDLEPDPTFIISLRKKIIKSNNSKFRLPRNLNIIGVGLLAILTLSLLIYTFDFGGHSTGTLVNQAIKEPGFGVENDVDKSIERDWKESPLFESGSDTLIGEEGRLGFSYDDGEILRFYPDKTQKYIWYFWGEEKEFDGVLKFLGTHENDEKQSVVYGGDFYKANNKADRQVHTSMNLPKSGMWRLDAYIGEKLFGTVFVKVHTQSQKESNVLISGGYTLEGIMGVLLGTLGLFYPLLIASVITFVFAFIKRSWIWMLLSAILLYPDAWFFSGYPPFPWAKFVPLFQVILAIIFYLLKRNR